MKSYKSAKKVEGLTSDIIIYHYNLLKIPIRKITLIDSFPTMLSDISLFANASDITNVQFTTNFTINEIFIEEL